MHPTVMLARGRARMLWGHNEAKVPVRWQMYRLEAMAVDNTIHFDQYGAGKYFYHYFLIQTALLFKGNYFSGGAPHILAILHVKLLFLSLSVIFS